MALVSMGLLVAPAATAATTAPKPHVNAAKVGSGVRVDWGTVPTNVASFDVIRTVNGVDTNLTPAGIRGHRLIDSQAPAGATYTVKVHSLRTASKNRATASSASTSSNAKVGDTLGSSSVPAAAKAKAAKPLAKARSHAVVSHRARGAIVDPCTRTGALATSETWSPADCPSGYMLTGDVRVPDTMTLTILPNTLVYFATTSDHDELDGITNKVDLIVDGSLLVQGNNADGLVFFLSAADTVARGDWGLVRLNSPAASSPNSPQRDSLVGLDAEDGTGVVAIGTAPVVDNVFLYEMLGGPSTLANAALSYWNSVAGLVIDVNNLGISGLPSSTDVNALGVDATNNLTPITVNVTDSFLEGGTRAVWINERNAGGPATIHFTDANSYFYGGGPSHNGAIELYAVESSASSFALAKAKALSDNAATITTDLNHSEVYGDYDGIYADATSADAAASVNNLLHNDTKIGPEGGVGRHGVHTVLNAPDNTTSTTGVDHSFIDAYDWGITQGATSTVDGNARTVTNVVNGSEVHGDSGDDGAGAVQDNATANGGNATALPTVTDSKLLSAYGKAWDEESHTSNNGNATTTPTVDHGTLSTAGCCYGYPDAAFTSATVGQALASTRAARPTAVFDTGNALVDPTFTNSTVSTTDAGGDGVDLIANAQGDGDATIPVTIHSSNISGNFDAVYAEASADHAGNAAIHNDVLTSTLSSSGSYREDSGSGDALDEIVNGGLFCNKGCQSIGANPQGDATIDGSVVSSDLHADGAAVYTEAVSNGPSTTNTTINPSYVNSNLRSNLDDVIDAFASNSPNGTHGGGSATSSPSIDNSTLTTHGDPNYSNGGFGYALWATASADGQEIPSQAAATPAVAGATVAPVITGSQLDSLYGVNLRASDNNAGNYRSDTPDAGPNTFPGTVTVAGSITDSRITAGDGSYNGASIEGDAFANDTTGLASVTTLVDNSSVVSGMGMYFIAENSGQSDDYYYDNNPDPNTRHDCGTACDTRVNGVGGDVLTAPVIRSTKHSEVFSSTDGIEAESITRKGAGDATGRTEVRGLNLTTREEGVYLENTADQAGIGTLEPTIVDNAIGGTLCAGCAKGIRVENTVEDASAHGGARPKVTDVAVPDLNIGGAIAGNTIDSRSMGIQVQSSYDTTSPGTSTSSILVAGNTITRSADTGIVVTIDGGGPSDAARILSNVISDFKNAGITQEGAAADIRSNVISDGTAGNRVGIQTTDLSGDETTPGTISCNTISGTSTAVQLNESGTTQPAVNENNFVDRAGVGNTTDLSSSGGTVDAGGNWWGTTVQSEVDNLINAPTETVSTTPLRDDLACRGGYIVDGLGGTHAYGPGTPAATGAPSWNQDLARAIAVRSDGTSGYVLDAYGERHPFSGAPLLTGPNFNLVGPVAKDLVLRPDMHSGYELDAWGAVHRVGDAPAVAFSEYHLYQDLARRLVLRPDGVSGYVLYKDGHIATFARPGVTIPAVTVNPSWSGDVGRDITLLHDGHSGYILDYNGPVHPMSTTYGTVPPVPSAPSFAPKHLGRALTYFGDTVDVELDGWGARHPVKADALPFTPPNPGPSWPGWDIARDLDGRMAGG